MSFLTLPAGAAARPTIVGVTLVTDIRDILPSSLFVVNMEVVGPTGPFAWDPASLLPDDGATVIRPTDIAALDPGRWIKLASPTPPPGSGAVHFTLSGEFSGAITPGFFDPPLIADVGFTVAYVHMARRTAGSGGSTRCDVLKNGVTIFSGAPPTIAAAAGDNATDIVSAFTAGMDVFTPGDVLEVQLISTEAFLPGPPPGPEGLRVIVAKV